MEQLRGENLRGAGLMTLAMAGFAVEDSLIKALSTLLPTWQILMILGLGGSLVFGMLTLAAGQPLYTRKMLSAPVLLRNLGELVGVLAFITALSLIDLSSASAILQATPLAVTLGAALFLRETVGWRRWSAVMIGFFGVLLVVRPGLSGFDGNAIFALIAVAGLALRDVATRGITASLSSRQLCFLAFLISIPAAAALSVPSPTSWVAMPPWALAFSAMCIAVGGVAYLTLIQGTRIGDLSFVTPFRYTRIVFALIAGGLVFGERPDAMMLLGTLIIVASGLYTFWREGRRQAAA
ncbi:MAG: DMT family transporter [Marinibacterium sp.]|nr:DMT family transporter [Marinibacterium sp.]